MTDAVDRFERLLAGLETPPDHAFSITPHDANELTYVTRGIWVGGDGDVVLVTLNDEEVTFSAAVAGTIIPIRAKQVKSTGTTASSLLGLY